MSVRNHYAVLGIPHGATAAEVEVAYERARRMSRLRQWMTGRSTSYVRQAYEVLRDPERRRAYDQQLQKLLVNLPIQPF